MKSKRKQYSAKFKAKVALAALNGHHTLSELSAMYEVHSMQISKWKSHLNKEAENIFTDKRRKVNESNEKLQDNLYNQIGKQKVEIDWLKKKVGLFYPQ